MLITLRNSGAEGIQYTPVIDDKLKLEILLEQEKADRHSPLYDIFLKGQQLDAFVVDSAVQPTLLTMTVDENGWGGEKNDRYEIHLEVNSCHYRLYYEKNVKPDFFKKLFKAFYPEMADKQVEELI